MLKHGLFGMVVAIITAILGTSLLMTEPSPVKWMGLLAIFGGFLVAIRSWTALSIHAEEITGQQPPWHIQRVLTTRQQ